jgi:hypothetical protein
MAEAPVESPTSFGFSSLCAALVYNSQLYAHVPPTSGHTTDQCLAARFAVGIARAPKQSCRRPCVAVGIGNEFALSSD